MLRSSGLARALTAALLTVARPVRRNAASVSSNTAVLAPRKPPRPPLVDKSTTHLLPPTSVYIHLPFCRRRCYYCDFDISVVGKAGAANPDVHAGMSMYVDTVCREIAACIDPPPPGGAPRPPLETVFFGGGTPSLLPPPLLARLMDALASRFGPMAPGAEVSMEMDPGTFDRAQLREYLSLGVSRVSLGVQSFQDDMLTACGRSHGVADARAAVALVASETPNWSLDLISGLPGLTEGMWAASLQEAIAACPSHVSCYDLQVEPGTAFGRWYVPGASPLPAEDAAAGMYRHTTRALSDAGYAHYEVSNHAVPGRESRHNAAYWASAPVHAFGLAAASYVHGARFTRPRSRAAYARWVDGYEAAGGAPAGFPTTAEPARERLTDAIMLSARTAKGIDLVTLRSRFGDDAASALESALRSQPPSLVHLEPKAGGGGAIARARLNDPDGFLVSNTIISALFAAVAPVIDG